MWKTGKVDGTKCLRINLQKRCNCLGHLDRSVHWNAVTASKQSLSCKNESDFFSALSGHTDLSGRCSPEIGFHFLSFECTNSAKVLSQKGCKSVRPCLANIGVANELQVVSGQLLGNFIGRQRFNCPRFCSQDWGRLNPQPESPGDSNKNVETYCVRELTMLKKDNIKSFLLVGSQHNVIWWGRGWKVTVLQMQMTKVLGWVKKVGNTTSL